ncbi:MAG: hypothetical protein DHS20C18_33620 [Saprospiraceae bacterium]|nr:MAG: hypothetical protein DHS20C18_33620 [Saprospiraceae bacterium]
MKAYIKYLENFILQTSSWIFLTAILAFSYVVMQMSGQLGWSAYLGLIGSFCLLFFPVLLLATARERWTKAGKTRVFYLLWAIFFVAYPIALTLLGIQINHLPFTRQFLDPMSEVNQQGILWLAIILLAIELLLQVLSRSSGKRKTASWILKLSIPKLAIIVVFVFSLMIVPINNFFQDKVAGASTGQFLWIYFFSVIQVFLIYLSYYLFYHIHHHFLFNKVLKERGFFYYLFGAIALILVLSPIYAEVILRFPVVYELKMHTLGFFKSPFEDPNYLIPIFIFMSTLPLIIIVEWYKQVNAINILEKEKADAELALLKQQINPHFFFNTLNNLYAMSLTQEKDTPKTILQLSALMRYVIYKGKEDKVKLSKEISYLKDYIDLQKIRLHKTVAIRFDIQVQNEAIDIPPLLFIVLIENAFKHGIEPAEKHCFLHVKLSSTDQSICFECHNSIEVDTEGKEPGIGLKNLQRRLELHYPNQHQLKIQESPTDYKATLTINL